MPSVTLAANKKNELVRVPTAEESGRQALALIDNLKNRGFNVPPRVFDYLDVAGFHSDEAQAAVITMAIVAGVEPAHLIHIENIRAVAKTWKWTSEAGAIPGEHYYLIPFDDTRNNNKRTYAPVPAVKWLRTSVDQHGIQTGVTYVLEQKPLFAGKLAEYMDYYIPDAEPDKGNRGHLARFVPWMNGRPLITDPDAGWSFGYFLAKGIKRTWNDEEYYVSNDAKKLTAGAASNTGARRAQTRAERLACYDVTRTLYRVDSGTLEQHLAAILQIAQDRLRSGEILRDAPDDEMFVEAEAGRVQVDGIEGDGVIDGEFSEGEPPTPEIQQEPPVVVQTPRKEKREKKEEAPVEAAAPDHDWREISDAMYAEATPDCRTLLNDLSLLREGVRAREDTMATLRGWLCQVGKFGPADEFATNQRLLDLVIYIMFGAEAGAKVWAKQAQHIFPLLARRDDAGAWIYQPGTEAEKSLHEVIARAREAVADAF